VSPATETSGTASERVAAPSVRSSGDRASASRHGCHGGDRLIRCGSVSLRREWQDWPAQVPVPGIFSVAGTRIFEGLELEPLQGKPDLATVGKQQLSICRHEMGHLPSPPNVPGQLTATGNSVV